MTVRCVVLLSGGLDSMLAVRIMQDQQIDVEALNFKTIFTCCQDHAGHAARSLGVGITVIGQEDDYLDLVRQPRFGYGKGANPCVDCRIYMFERAKRFMEQVGASFLVSGEVVGQRPMSQKRRDLDAISYHSQCDDLLLRPLSAKLLPPTLPERTGWVDRSRLYGFQGRGRRGLIALAARFGLQEPPTPSTGCVLTEPRFSRKVFDLLDHSARNDRWAFELLKVGRHFRWDPQTKVVVGRNENENDRLDYLHQLRGASSTASLYPENFLGPRVLLVGPRTPEALDFAAGLVLRYAKRFNPDNALILVQSSGEREVIRGRTHEAAQQAVTLATM